MTVINGREQLREDDPRLALMQSSPLSYIIEHITPSAQLHNKEYVALSLKVLIQAHDVTMTDALENEHLLHDLFSLGYLSREEKGLLLLK